MKLACVAFLLLAAATAHAEDARCKAGIELARRGELPRAALYLESCVDDEGVRARSAVTHALEGTQLSHVTISSSPAGLEGETDAMPGEKFTTPVTIWAKAGTYKITVGGRTVETTLAPHSRTTVLVDVQPPRKPAKDGVVDFGEDPEQHQGAPPAVEHGTMLPKKYLGPSAPAGEPIDDPLAGHGSHAALDWRLGARAGAGLFDRTNASAGFGFTIAAVAARPLDGPVMLATRLDGRHRDLDAIGVDVGLAVVALTRRSFVVSAGVSMRGEIHVQDTLDGMEVHRAAVGAAADLDVAVSALPLAIGLRVEQGFSELMPGVRGRALVIELGYDWRRLTSARLASSSCRAGCSSACR